MSRDARIVVDALQRDTWRAPVGWFARFEMVGDHVPDRRALLFVDRGPSRHLVALAGLQRAAAVELQFGNSFAHALRRRAGLEQPADANYVAALLVIGIGVEEIVADVLEYVLDLGAGHAREV